MMKLTNSTTVSSSTLIMGELKRMRNNLDAFERQVRSGSLDVKTED